MFTINLTEEQFTLLEQLVGDKFNEVAQAWLPAEETKDMNNLCYDTILNLRAVRYAKQFDSDYPEYVREFVAYDKVDYLKEVHFVTDQQLAQQGIDA
jgi:hypothetical protein